MKQKTNDKTRSFYRWFFAEKSNKAIWEQIIALKALKLSMF